MHAGMRGARLATAAAFALAVALATPMVASAHVPFIESAQRSDVTGTSRVPYPQAQPLPAPTISRAIYAFLSPASRFDSFEFTVPSTVTAEVGLIVPKRAGLQNFRPDLILYAEGADSTITARDPGKQPRASFYEPFSAASFYVGPTATATFEPGERYFVVVTPGSGARRSGAYVLTFGGAEQFTPLDWATSAADMPTIWLGSWSGGPARPGAYACCVLLVVLLVTAAALWFRRARQRRRQAAEQPGDADIELPNPTASEPIEGRDAPE